MKTLPHWTRQHYTITVPGQFGPVYHLVRGYFSPGKLFGIHKHGKFRRWIGLGHWRITHLRTGLDILPGTPIKHLPVARDVVLDLEKSPQLCSNAQFALFGKDRARVSFESARARYRRTQKWLIK